MGNLFLIIVGVAVCAFAILVLAILIELIFSHFHIDLYERLFGNSHVTFLITLTIVSFFVAWGLSGFYGPAEYESFFHKSKFNTQFVVEIQNEDDKVYYEKADCLFEQGTLSLDKIEFSNNGYLNVENMGDELSYTDFASFEDQNGNLWKVKLIKEIPENERKQGTAV